MNSTTLITGGLGFIGSNLAHGLRSRGVSVRVVDNMEPGLGGNPHNLVGCDGVEVFDWDLRGALPWKQLLAGVDRVFHCAGNGDHGASIRDPRRDLELNAGVTLNLLEAVRSHAPGARVVTLGTRAEYGPVTRLPVDERHATEPQGCYAVSKLAATRYARAYAKLHGMDVVAMRLTNVYGPRAQIRHPGYGVANWFLRQALTGECIEVFGAGRVRRDYVYIDDAVQALIAASECLELRGEIVNLGGTPTVSLAELAEDVLEVVGRGTLRFLPYPPGKKAIEPGDFQADASKLMDATGWRASYDLKTGMKRTADFYRGQLPFYIDPQSLKAA